jgi:hypothetical protein
MKNVRSRFFQSPPDRCWLMNERVRVANAAREAYARPIRDRGPVWVSALNYYFLVLFFAAAVFFVVFAILYDGYDDTPWLVAGGSSVAFVVSLFLFREVVMRRARSRALAARRLSHHLNAAKRIRPSVDGVIKLTLQRNDELLHEIRLKSDAAKVLGKFADGHREVFELCDAYLSLASAELGRARVGSPRIPAIRKGTISVSKRHRYHMLRWAEIKARAFTTDVNDPARPLSDKLEAAEDTLTAVERAFTIYPEETALNDSLALLRVFLSTGRVRSYVESAERASQAGATDEALDNYRLALAALQESAAPPGEQRTIRERIGGEIARLNTFEGDRRQDNVE